MFIVKENISMGGQTLTQYQQTEQAGLCVVPDFDGDFDLYHYVVLNPSL